MCRGWGTTGFSLNCTEIFSSKNWWHWLYSLVTNMLHSCKVLKMGQEWVRGTSGHIKSIKRRLWIDINALVTNDKKVKGRKHCISKWQEIGMAVVFSSAKPDHILVPLNECTGSKYVAWPSVWAFVQIWHTIVEEMHQTQRHKTKVHRWSFRRKVRSRAALGKIRLCFVLSVQHTALVYACITEVAQFMHRSQEKHSLTILLWSWLRANRMPTFNLTWH